MLGFLLSKTGLSVVLAVFVLGIIGASRAEVSYWRGQTVSLRKADAAALAEAQARQKASASISSASQTASAADRVQIVTRYRTLMQKVPQVVGEGALNCSPPDAWVDLWNEAAK